MNRLLAQDIAALQAWARTFRMEVHLPEVVRSLAQLTPEQPRATDARVIKEAWERLAPYADYHERYPFPAAPQGAFTGKIVLGLQHANKLPVTITDDDLCRHGGVFGSSGCGKTSFAHLLIKQVLRQGKKVFILDPKDDSYHVAVSHTECLVLSPRARINVLQLPRFLGRDEFINMFTAVYAAAWYSGENQKQVLDAALLQAFTEHETPSLADVKRIVDKMHSPKLTYQRRDAITGISNRLARFERMFPAPFTTRKGITYEELFQHSLYMPALFTDEHTTFLYTLLVHLLYLHNRRNGIRNTLDYLLVNDEGNRFWNVHQTNIGEAPTLVNLQGMIREFGIGLLHTSVDEASLHPVLKSNTHIHVAMAVASGHEEDEAVKNLGLTPDQREYLRKRLVRGQCIIRINGNTWKEPILSCFPYSNQPKQLAPAARAQAEERINQYSPDDLPPTFNQEQQAASQHEAAPSTGQAQAPSRPGGGHEHQPTTNQTRTDTTDCSPGRAPSTPSPPPDSKGERCSPQRGARTAPCTDQDERPRTENEPRRQPVQISVNEERLLRACTERLLVATQAYHRAGLARAPGQKAKDGLVRLGLLTASTVIVKQGRGGNALLLEPTNEGYEVLGRQAPKGTRGGDSAQHRWLIQELASSIPGAIIEFMIGGTKSVDLYCRYNPEQHQPLLFSINKKLAPGAHLAIEVEVSDPVKSGANNITKNDEAGIAHTIVAVMPKHRDAAKTGLAKRLPHELRDAYSIVNVFELLEEVGQ